MNVLGQRRPILIVAAVGLATVLLIGNFIAHDLWPFAIAAVVMAALWLLGWRRGWATPIDLGFVGTAGLAAFGAIAHTGRPTATLAALLMLAGTVSALAAWDLMRFDLRMRAFAPKDLTGLESETQMRARSNLPGLAHNDLWLERRHLRRVAVVTSVGLGAGALAILLRTQFTFAAVALVLLLALLLFALSLRELRADA